MSAETEQRTDAAQGWIGRLIAFCLHNRFVVFLLFAGVVLAGVVFAPFDWPVPGIERYPVPVDAIPDIGENQQIVFTDWPGRSPQDVEDQITYPLTASMLALPGVKTVRSFSMFGFSSLYVIFEDGVDFYWARTRVLEKLNSLPPDELPAGVRPALGPDATPLGQVFWYTLEGRDRAGRPAGGWDLHELRAIQDWKVRYELLAVPGVAEVASVGGYVQEYQVELDPDALHAHGVTLPMVVAALRKSNLDIGARTLEINRVEYVIRGLGFVKQLADLETAVVKTTDDVPLRVRDVAHVTLGPALRRGALDKGGAEAVGGVVVVRYGANPLDVIKRVRTRIAQLAPSLDEKPVAVRRADGSEETVMSRVTIVPFYDRTGLIRETLGTLRKALEAEVLVTIIVVVVMLMHLRSSLTISGLLPIAVLMCFVGMKLFGVDANIVALSGIAIAIGTMVDMGIVLNENILKRLDEAGATGGGATKALGVIRRASAEVGGAVLTSVATTVVGFLPVFTMQAAEGRLFRPLALTKTFALLSSLVVALTLLPPMAFLMLKYRYLFPALIAGVAVAVAKVTGSWFLAVVIMAVAVYHVVRARVPALDGGRGLVITNWLVVAAVAVLLTRHWMPIGADKGLVRNLVFAGGMIGPVLLGLHLFQRFYGRLLRWCLAHKLKFLLMPVLVILFGSTIWLGFDRMFGFVPRGLAVVGIPAQRVRTWAPWAWAAHALPGLGREFMPALDEGSFLLMPTTMPHASIGEAMDVLSKQDMALAAIPEVTEAVGKIGRAESALDPAPISMIETVINYAPEYMEDEDGKRRTFAFEPGATDLFRREDGTPVPAPDGRPYTVRGAFEREAGRLVPDPRGRPFRLWRPPLEPDLNPGRAAWAGIRSPDDIWQEILRVTRVPGTTSAPKLQPIATRIVMLQSGMRAPMGVKIFGKGKVTLEAMEAVGLHMERFLKEVPAIKRETVNAERIVGKPYLELEIDREAMARYGLNVVDVQDVIQAAIGGMRVTTTVEGRERYHVLVRYKRERRDSLESLERVLVPTPAGAQIPIKALIRDGQIGYRRGPQLIKSERSALVSYVLFDRPPNLAEVDVVRTAQDYLKRREREFSEAYAECLARAHAQRREPTASEIDALPGLNLRGCSYEFAGSYENQVRSERRLRIVLPLALLLIFVILYLQFRSVATSILVFSGVFVAWAGGFVMIWLYGQEWFFNFSVFGAHMRDLFQMHTVNLSVAVWVGFLALFGIATDDGVVMATFLRQSFEAQTPRTIGAVREATVAAGERRVRPCLMTTATTILALLPVLTSRGRGADIMVPMAIPSFGGMVFEVMTMLVVPVLYCAMQEFKVRRRQR
ncbi:MAG: efflux RND transporter permease subunit [Kiritimatiellae bacterium]|nr:efflux RND transporter permease subunit [Kiritimatiellia bacterium]